MSSGAYFLNLIFPSWGSLLSAMSRSDIILIRETIALLVRERDRLIELAGAVNPDPDVGMVLSMARFDVNVRSVPVVASMIILLTS